MRQAALTVTLFLSVLMAAGCGYTQIQKVSHSADPCAGLPDTTLPDLMFTTIQSATVSRAPADPANPGDTATVFHLTVLNIGYKPFRASIMVRYADDENDIQRNAYRYNGNPQALDLNAGDSTIVDVEEEILYQPGTHIRFFLQTDSYPLHAFDPVYYFGREPVCELSYDNNVADYIIP